MQQPGGAPFYGQSAVDNVGTVLLGIKSQIFNAVFITAGVVNLLCVNANCLTDAGGTFDRTGHYSIGHCNTSY